MLGVVPSAHFCLTVGVWAGQTVVSTEVCQKNMTRVQIWWSILPNHTPPGHTVIVHLRTMESPVGPLRKLSTLNCHSVHRQKLSFNFMISVFILFQFYVHIFIFCIGFMEIKKCLFSTLYVNYYKSLNMFNKVFTQYTANCLNRINSFLADFSLHLSKM